MNKITQEEFNRLERNGSGFIVIPANTDLTLIETFPRWCSFGEGCSFGEECSFGERCNFGKECSFGEECFISGNELSGFKVRSLEGVGDFNRKLYVWNTVNGIFCQAGCFFGTKNEFILAVKEKYGDNSDYERSLEFLLSLKG